MASPPFSLDGYNERARLFLADYEIGDLLGLGAFSEVRLCRDKATGKSVALKVIDKAASRAENVSVERELAILSQVKHRNIVSLHRAHDAGAKLLLIVDYVSGGELFDAIIERGQYTEDDAATIVRDIVDAVDYLHSLNIVHRDLKPENLLLSDASADARVMITDFGLAKIMDTDQLMQTACGTLGYVAPEVLRRTGYSKEVDLWSIGVITFILLCGYPPFYGLKDAEVYEAILRCKYEFEPPAWDDVSDFAKDFISRLLRLDPSKRMSTQEALDHPWLARARTRVPSNINLATGDALRRFNSRQSLAVLLEDPGENELLASTVVRRSYENGFSGISPTASVHNFQQGKLIRVLCYNLHLRPPQFNAAVPEHKDARLAHFLREHVAHFDIIGLQEVYDYGSLRQRRLIDSAARAGLSYHVATPPKSFLQGKIDGGVVILSRYPIVASDVYKFNRGVFGDRLVAKSVVYAKVLVAPLRHVHVFATHLQASYLNAEGEEDEACPRTRRQQLEHVYQFMRDKLGDGPVGEPALLFGNMEIDARGPTAGRGAAAPTAEYSRMLSILRGERHADTPWPVFDVLHEALGEFPVLQVPLLDVSATGTVREGGKVAPPPTAAPSCGQYVFWLPADDSAQFPPPTVDLKSVRVEPFAVTGEKFAHLSTTAGIALDLFVPNYKQRT